MGKKSKIVIALYVLLAMLAIGIYVYQVVGLKKPPTENLVRIVLMLLVSVFGIVRVLEGRKNTLRAYERAYAEHLRDAFLGKPALRKKLLSAARDLNENREERAAQTLTALKPECRQPNEYYAVYLMLALTQSDLGNSAAVVEAYEYLITRGLASGTVYNNLGHQYMELGKTERALEMYEASLRVEPNSPMAYNNMAKLYYDEGDLEQAISLAEKALELDANVYQASTLLAIIHTQRGEPEKAETYYHKAVATGQNAAALRLVMNQRKAGSVLESVE